MPTALDHTAPIARRAADDLAAIREQWGDLLAAIGRRPANEWPPREARGFLDQLAADNRCEDDAIPAEPVVGRLPLVLREHPAPLNLDALDTALDVERALFDLADQVAERVQRPIRSTTNAHGRATTDQADAAHPYRWHYQAATSPGSRRFGLHWAAVWIEGRALNERRDDLFESTPPRLLDEIAHTTRQARRAVEHTLDRDGRTTTLDDPCPWCGGTLTMHTFPGDPEDAFGTCSTGETCGAPVDFDGRHRRIWRGPDLAGLWGALDGHRRSAAA
ncbi:hypothetical protein ACIQU6_38815 [Streptomyces sp. NPDC090442]|uniref:hypothetical protein n=1 Tax=Streptomyces sp. NPDC090442 TaxID=3365962 RepID=UPI0037FCB900